MQHKLKTIRLTCSWEIVFEKCDKQSTHQTQVPQRRRGRMLTSHLLTHKHSWKDRIQPYINGSENFSDHNKDFKMTRLKPSMLLHRLHSPLSLSSNVSCPLLVPLAIHLPSCWSATTQHTPASGPCIVLTNKFSLLALVYISCSFCQIFPQKLPSLRSSLRPPIWVSLLSAFLLQ